MSFVSCDFLTFSLGTVWTFGQTKPTDAATWKFDRALRLANCFPIIEHGW